jgi:uncharacterized protein (TIGR02646 family)
MIQLNRSRQGIASGLTGPKRLERELLLLRGEHSGELKKLKSRFWKGKEHWKAGKSTLIADSHGKCAYCEAPTTIVAHGDVEHFRPKSIYWWLAYCYDNHLFACQICNQTHKGDHFPVSGERIAPPSLGHIRSDAQLQLMAGTLAPDPTDPAAVKAFRQQLEAESADLPDPYGSAPESFFRWLADDVLKEVIVQARSKKSNHQRVFSAAEQFYGLNREELRRGRWSLVYQHLAAHKQDLDELDAIGRVAEKRSTIMNRIKAMIEDAQPFAGMARYFVRHEWKLKL